MLLTTCVGTRSGLRSTTITVFCLLDTYNDRRNAVFLSIYASRWDGRHGSLQQRWGASIQAGILSGSAGAESMKIIWTVEIAIPFSQLRFEQSDVMNWGLNFGREIARKREIAAWNEAPKTYGGRWQSIAPPISAHLKG